MADFTYQSNGEHVAYEHDGSDVYRARVILDTDPQPPEHEYACPVFELTYSRSWGEWGVEPKEYGQVSARHDGLPMAFEDAFNRLTERYSNPLPILDRWLKMFHGGSLNEQSAYNYRDEVKLVSYDTRAMREFWGQTGDLLETSDPDAGEWIEYVAGEVYGFIIEHAKLDYGQDFQEFDPENADWEEVDSCWGFYGAEYAEQCATEALKFAEDNA